MSDRRSQWAGAKALAKLIKPRKESSRERGGDRDKEMDRERERAKSAPDIPLPPTPPLFPPETPPGIMGVNLPGLPSTVPDVAVQRQMVFEQTETMNQKNVNFLISHSWRGLCS